MPNEPLKLLVLGAHPDDAEFHAGGLATLYRRLGQTVKFVSLTNGEAGHHLRFGPELISIRRAEAHAAASTIGAMAEVWEYPDGQLEPTLELRERVIREIRRFAPDLVLTHRTNDYHPDHRAVAHVVRDACYLVTVPALVRDVPALRRDPVVAYLPDRFQKPAPISPDVVIDVGECLDAIVGMLACHHSQVFEWLPYNRRQEHLMPADDAARRTWLAEWFKAYLRPMADRYRPALVAAYGPTRGAQIEFAEVFEVSEYAAPLDEAARARLFGEIVAS